MPSDGDRAAARARTVGGVPHSAVPPVPDPFPQPAIPPGSRPIRRFGQPQAPPERAAVIDPLRAEPAAVARLAVSADRVRTALERGLAVAAAVLAKQDWHAAADPHLHGHLVRREARRLLSADYPTMTAAKSAAALGGNAVALGSLPMSGLLLRPTAVDEVRVWRCRGGVLPAVGPSASRLRFLRQRPPSQPTLDMPGMADEDLAVPCHTVLAWDCDEHGRLNMLDLVYPSGVDGSRIQVSWRHPISSDPRPSVPEQ